MGECSRCGKTAEVRTIVFHSPSWIEDEEMRLCEACADLGGYEWEEGGFVDIEPEFSSPPFLHYRRVQTLGTRKYLVDRVRRRINKAERDFTYWLPEVRIMEYDPSTDAIPPIVWIVRDFEIEEDPETGEAVEVESDADIIRLTPETIIPTWAGGVPAQAFVRLMFDGLKHTMPRYVQITCLEFLALEPGIYHPGHRPKPEILHRLYRMSPLYVAKKALGRAVKKTTRATSSNL